MKYLMTCLLAIPFLTSCNMVEEEYYGNSYYNPPPRMEVHPNYHSHGQGQHHYHGHSDYRPAPMSNNNHGHFTSGTNQAPVRHYQPQIQASQNVHAHGQAGNNVVVHPGNQPTPVQSQQKIHGHAEASDESQQHSHSSQSTETNISSGFGQTHGHR